GAAHQQSRRPGRGSTTTSGWRRTACAAASRCEKARAPAAAVGSPKTCRRPYCRPTNQLLSKWHSWRTPPWTEPVLLVALGPRRRGWCATALRVGEGLPLTATPLRLYGNSLAVA